MLKLQSLAAGAALSILLAVSATAQTAPPATTPPAPPAATPKAGAPATPPAATTPAPAPTTAAPAATPPAAGKKKAAAAKGERTPESLACSKEADEKNIHGKPARPNFMRKCKADAAKAAKAAVKKS